MQRDYAIYKERREQLLELVRDEHAAHHGPIVLFAAFESSDKKFRQDSSFYYFTGIREPGAALVIEPSGQTVLFVPNYGDVRKRWTDNTIEPNQQSTDLFMVDEVRPLGQQCTGYQVGIFSGNDIYEELLERLTQAVAGEETIFTLCPDTSRGYVAQRCLLARLDVVVAGLVRSCIDISGVVAQMRRQKDKSEIALLYRAVEVTMLAQQAAAQAIGDGMTECEVQAHAEFMMTGACMQSAFSSVVASGRNSTVLHYDENAGTMLDG